MIQRIAILNKSRTMSNSDAVKVANVCTTQISRDVAPAWNRIAIPVIYYSSENLVPAHSAKLYLFDNTDQQGALGYHDETMQGQVYAKVFVRTIINYNLPTLYNSQHPNYVTVSSVITHEIIELFCNPYVDLWADGTVIEQGSEYAYEACDAVEADIYQIYVTNSSQLVSVSNFLHPEYFDTATPNGTQLDHMNILSTPYTLSTNGYAIVRQSGQISEIFGAKYPQFLKDYHKINP